MDPEGCSLHGSSEKDRPLKHGLAAEAPELTSLDVGRSLSIRGRQDANHCEPMALKLWILRRVVLCALIRRCFSGAAAVLQTGNALAGDGCKTMQF